MDDLWVMLSPEMIWDCFKIRDGGGGSSMTSRSLSSRRACVEEAEDGEGSMEANDGEDRLGDGGSEEIGVRGLRGEDGAAAP